MLKQGKYLITTNAWFYGPDGEQYRAVYGHAELVEAKSEMGFVPSRSANWFVRVGSDDKHVLIAGCQIHYALRSEEKPLKRAHTYVDKETGETRGINAILFMNDDDDE